MQLIMNPGAPDEQVFLLPEGPVTIGRAAECSVGVIHKSLSRLHARLELEAGRIFLVDLGSKNGTFIGAVQIQRRELREGDTFRCGQVTFQLASTSLSVSEEPLPTQVHSLQTRFSPTTMGELLRPHAEPGANTALKMKPVSGEGRANNKLQILLKVSQLLSSPGSIDELLDRVLQLVFQILEVDRAAILLVEPLSGQLRPRVARASGELPPGPFYSQHIVEYVRGHGVAALFSDARRDPRLGSADSVLQQSICASMCVPLMPRDSVLGVLYVDNLSRAHGFTQEDLEFLTAFGNQAAIALDNSLLRQQLEEEAVLRTNYLRFFPPATLKKLQLARSAQLGVIETEVTILFSDISQFTELSSKLQPRQVVDLLNEYFPVMADIVFRYEGTLEKYIGDALMAVWGAPFAHPDDVDRAVCAAVEMQQALARLNARWRAKGWTEIRIHVGINTGRAAAGNIGSEQYLQYATIGDAANLASRVCAAARPGEILLTEATLARWRERSWPVTPLPPLRGPVTPPLAVHRVNWQLPPGVEPEPHTG
ncbi:GAF domain-containing protein [Archangium gephyra]|uniref:adenylate/guanylate cyclase domain-containing protein n=1 Tax=Archangium gephyra TaxID=48 RepID=UPI0035D51587